MKIWQRQAIAIFMVGCAAIVTAQEAAPKPKISNAKVQELSASAGLKATVDGLVQKLSAQFRIFDIEVDAVWIGDACGLVFCLAAQFDNDSGIAVRVPDAHMAHSRVLSRRACVRRASA